MDIVYKVPEPYGKGRIEVYGERDMSCYEWRVIVDGQVIKDSRSQGYGCAEIALRDALIWSSSDDR